jgi:hypothetical protein
MRMVEPELPQSRGSEPRDALGQSAQQCVTVRDTFVAGQAQAALNVAGGRDEAFGFLQMRLRKMRIFLS